MNYKKKLFFVNCIILCSLSLIIVKAVNSYFYIAKQETIEFMDLDEYERNWLTLQPKTIRHDFNVFNQHEILNILNLTNNKGCFFSQYFELNKPGYNNNDNKESLGMWYLKTPPKNLITVYFKPRNNPFNKNYPTGDNQHTLDELLKYEIAISEAYIFWDANQKEKDPNVSIHRWCFTIYNDQNNETYKEKLIQEDLYNDKITKEKINVELNCYNSTSNTGIVSSFKLSKYNDKIIEAVYFDDGIRITDPNIKINDLIKLTNGAKNIYLYSFKIIEREKERWKTTLPTCSDPYTAIRDWKRKNNLIDFPPLIKESDYKWIVDGDNYTLTQTIETKDKIHLIFCDSDYKEKLEQWKNQCIFKPGEERSSKNIMFETPPGIDNRTPFFTNNDNGIYSYADDKYIYPTKCDDEIYFVKISRRINIWYSAGPSLSIFGKDDIELTASAWRDWKFYGYYDTTKPPQKPNTFNLKP